MWPYNGHDCYHNDDDIDKHWLKDIQQIINSIAIVIIVAVTAIDTSLNGIFNTVSTELNGAAS
jgi:hypothetical protein